MENKIWLCLYFIIMRVFVVALGQIMQNNLRWENYVFALHVYYICVGPTQSKENAQWNIDLTVLE